MRTRRNDMTWHDFLPTVVCGGEGGRGRRGIRFRNLVDWYCEGRRRAPPSVYIAMQNAIKNARGYARGYARTQLTPFLPQFARHKCFSVLQEPVDPFVHLRCRVRPAFPFLSFPFRPSLLTCYDLA
jgi:hypothetical protein